MTKGYIVEWQTIVGIKDVFFQSLEVANKVAKRAIDAGYVTAMRHAVVGEDGRLIPQDRKSSF